MCGFWRRASRPASAPPGFFHHILTRIHGFDRRAATSMVLSGPRVRCSEHPPMRLLLALTRWKSCVSNSQGHVIVFLRAKRQECPSRFSSERFAWRRIDRGAGRHPPPPRARSALLGVAIAATPFFLSGAGKNALASTIASKKVRPGTPRPPYFFTLPRGQLARRSRRRALRSKNRAWLMTADTVAGWKGFAIRNAGSGRSPVRKRSG